MMYYKHIKIRLGHFINIAGKRFRYLHHNFHQCILYRTDMEAHHHIYNVKVLLLNHKCQHLAAYNDHLLNKNIRVVRILLSHSAALGHMILFHCMCTSEEIA